VAVKATFSTHSFLALLLIVISLGLVLGGPPADAGPKPDGYWKVDDVRVGMKGQGRTVMKGTKIETFDAEVLGVLKNTSPGRDLILCRLSGLNLEKTGVIAGMSGSPIYIQGKLLGAVAYAWPYGKEPIAGVTPFCQMCGAVAFSERRALVRQARARRIGLRKALTVDGLKFKTITVSGGYEQPKPTAADGLWMVPLRTPLAATGFTAHSLALLRKQCGSAGLVPMQGGATTGKVAEQEKNTPLQPGSPLAVSLVRGDFDLSGIGTVTHVEGKRVYGWGHPFFGSGQSQLPLMTGYIHAINPRQSISFKMGSPLRDVGVINADVSTCIAGWLNRKPDMLPVHTRVVRDDGQNVKTFRVRVVRQRALMPTLVFSVLTNSVDLEGELPEEMTAELKATIEVEGHAPILFHDTFSGPSYAGGRAPAALYSQVAGVVSLMTHNSYRPVRIKRIDCETVISPGRRSAEIEAVELDSDTYAPGETLQATAIIRPHKGLRRRLRVRLPLPKDLPEGRYTATICDDPTNARATIRHNPTLDSPHNLEQIFEALKVKTAVKRTNLVVRVPVRGVGVALNGKALPELPASMVQIIGNTRRTGAQTIEGALVSRRPTRWVISGSEAVRFLVTKDKKVLARD
jgi:hypothetical protein